MLVIRFNRFGKRNQAAFRIVLQEKTKAPGHRHVEMLGSHNPHTKQTVLKKERILYWLGQGVQTSDRVHNLLVRESVIEGKIIPKKMPRPVKPATEEATAGKKEEEKPAENPVAEAPKAPETLATPETPVEAPKEETKTE